LWPCCEHFVSLRLCVRFGFMRCGLRLLPFWPGCASLGIKGCRPMKKIPVLLFSVCALIGSMCPAEAGNLSFGIPLPFPFLFYKFGSGKCGQTAENGYSKEGGYTSTTHKCCGVPWWLQYRVEEDCNMHLGQTTSMPGVGGIRD
jgi:hypothetical protein